MMSEMLTNEGKATVMKNRLLLVMAVLSIMVSCCPVIRAQEEMLTDMELTGRVDVIRSDTGDAVAVNLLVSDAEGDIEYRVTLNEKGLELSSHEDKMVKVTARKDTISGYNWIIVTAFEEVTVSE